MSTDDFCCFCFVKFIVHSTWFSAFWSSAQIPQGLSVQNTLSSEHLDSCQTDTEATSRCMHAHIVLLRQEVHCTRAFFRIGLVATLQQSVWKENGSFEVKDSAVVLGCHKNTSQVFNQF